jgi:hypothetical protein
VLKQSARRFFHEVQHALEASGTSIIRIRYLVFAAVRELQEQM